jgi:acyl-coenzyme A thioesterase PaaI-like protein
LSYLAPADGVDLAAEARVIQRGRSQTVSDVEVRDPSGRLVAKGLVTSRLF